MDRIPEPELMDSPEQVRAYADADFAQAHQQLVEQFRARFPGGAPRRMLDLGCGPADVTMRFARAFPETRLMGVDAGPNMLAMGRAYVQAAGLDDRIELIEGYLPGAELPAAAFDAVISNSLLHHLAYPDALWQAVRQAAVADAAVMVMDLCRPDSPDRAHELVAEHAADAPPVLRTDFFNSLCAAYRPEEVQAQIRCARLALQVERISDRHLLAWGRGA